MLGETPIQLLDFHCLPRSVLLTIKSRPSVWDQILASFSSLKKDGPLKPGYRRFTWYALLIGDGALSFLIG